MRRVPRSTAISPGRGADDLEVWVEGLCRAGVEAVQIRERQLSDRALLELTQRLVELADDRLLILVSARADLALASGADGVHLPSSGVPTGRVRELVGEALLVGRSTHNLDEISVAAAEGADYVYYSPVYATPGKREPVGLAGLERAVELGLPIVALGGLSIARVGPVASAGAAGVAGIRMFAKPAELGGLRSEVAGCARRDENGE